MRCSEIMDPLSFGSEGNLPSVLGRGRRVFLAGDSLKDFHGRAGSLD